MCMEHRALEMNIFDFLAKVVPVADVVSFKNILPIALQRSLANVEMFGD